MKDKQEFLMMMLFFVVLLGLGDILAIRYSLSHFKMNKDVFTQVGMMEYKNPADGRTLYFLMYTKGDK